MKNRELPPITIEDSDDPEIRAIEEKDALDEIFSESDTNSDRLPESMKSASLKKVYVLAGIGFAFLTFVYLAFYAIKRIYL